MSALPVAIGLCPNRTGDSSYVVAGVFLDDPRLTAYCDHCGGELAVYSREGIVLSAAASEALERKLERSDLNRSAYLEWVLTGKEPLADAVGEPAQEVPQTRE